MHGNRQLCKVYGLGSGWVAEGLDSALNSRWEAEDDAQQAVNTAAGLADPARTQEMMYRCS